MPSILKHVDCPSCGNRHHFCLISGELRPGLRYDYLCPQTGKKASLRSPSPVEVCDMAPPGAVSLAPARYSPPEGEDAAQSVSAVKQPAPKDPCLVDPKGANPGLQNVERAVHHIGDEVHSLTARVGDLEQRVTAPPDGAAPETSAAANVAANVHPTAGASNLREVLPAVTELAAKLGGLDKLAEIVNVLKETKE